MPLQHQSVTSHRTDGRAAVSTSGARGSAVATAAARRDARVRLLASRQYAVRTAPPSAIRPTDA